MNYYESIITGAVFITNCHHKSDNMSDVLSFQAGIGNKPEANWSYRYLTSL